MSGKRWSNEENEQLKIYCNCNMPIDNICERMNRSRFTINKKINELGFRYKYINKHDTRFKALYQDYNWCFDHYIIKGQNIHQMADECNASVRVIQKWCGDIYHLNRYTFKQYKKLSNLQYRIIVAGTLGDGHITNKRDNPSYIESHAIDEKDYLFWKYDKLKDCCESAPSYYSPGITCFNNQKYTTQSSYRFGTRGILQLNDIKDMSKIEKLKIFDKLMFALHLLDDGSRGESWSVCLAEWDNNEIEAYDNICLNRFNLYGHMDKNKPYYIFDANSSRKIDNIILEELPNNLDIVHKKIIDNKKIKKEAKYIFVISDENKIGLNRWCRENHKNYNKCKEMIASLGVNEISENTLLNEIETNK